MPDRTLKLRDLRAILKRYGCWEDPSRGKGSHTMFFRLIPATGAVMPFPLPTSRPDILRSYVRSCRKAFHLTAEDGVSDAEFYGD